MPTHAPLDLVDLAVIPLHRYSVYLDDAVAVYAEYVRHEGDYQRQFFLNTMDLPDYHGLVAVYRDRVLGFAFGNRSGPGHWWHDRVAEAIGKRHPALRKAWVLTQFNVLQAYRGQGVGTHLHNAILACHRYPNVLLSTQDHNRGAQRFYHRHGWRILHQHLRFSRDDEPYTIMHWQRDQPSLLDGMFSR